MSFPPTMVHRDIDEMYDDFLNHLVPTESRDVVAPREWSCALGYIQWYFIVSHPYMTSDAQGDPSRPNHQEILEEENAREDYVVDVLLACHYCRSCASGYKPRKISGRNLCEGHSMCHYVWSIADIAVQEVSMEQGVQYTQ